MADRSARLAAETSDLSGALSRSAASALTDIKRQLARARDRWRVTLLTEKALLGLSAILFVGLSAAGIELLFRPGPFVLLCLFLSVCATVFGALYFGLVVPLSRAMKDEAVARRIEIANPGLNNALINAIELANVIKTGPSRELIEAAIVQSGEQTRDIVPEKAIDSAGLVRAAKAAVAIVALTVGMFVLLPGQLSSALMQVLAPFSFVPAQGSAEIVSVRPGDTTVRAGAQVPIEVTIASSGGPTLDGAIYYRLDGASEVKARLTPSDRTHYVYSLAATASMAYRIEIGGTESRAYRIDVMDRPAVEKVDLKFVFPDYTELEPVEIEDAVDEQLDIRVPAGTIVRFAVETNRAVKGAYVDIAGGQDSERVQLELAPNRTAASGAVRLQIPSQRRYALKLIDDAGSSEDSPVWHSFIATADKPPRASLVAPGRNIEAAPGAQVSLVVRAADDYGLESVEIFYKRNKEGEGVRLHSWGASEIPSRTEAALTHEWKLSADSFAVGDIITYWAVAADRNADTRTESRRWEIRVVDAADKAKKLTATLEELLKAIATLVEIQDSAQKEARPLSARNAERGAWAPIKSKQLLLRETASAAVASARSGGPDVIIIRTVLKRLANGDMAAAVILAEKLVSAAQDASAASLEESQTKILNQLRRLLGALPRAIEKAKKEELEDEDSSDLPDVAAETLKDLADQLKKFADEQRKVIADTEDLAKIPVEDFTEEDKAKQEALAAIEEKWEKFMKDAASDLSALPKQDFSSEQLLKELIECFSEVEMAKDALSAKAAEIAVPNEQAGLELAEKLETHIEKWLPDTPDRDQWSMEQPLGEYETPSAELPTELEDLVGELMEEEEDTFAEMEDVTSSWMDSLDKGAGWDAMDGPISNMSAQGVTGNRLPNASEIGGRSGEGRTGQASGEMVEDTATGKGGRRTPTRLTPDAFLGGEIDDQSEDPAGGATGGGKISGAGGEGLEGPAPPHVDREMERLQGAQASLRNKAERIAMELRARDFPEADIELTLRSLRAVEADLKDGRYTNIARTRNVLLDGLERSREFVEGMADVQIDREGGPEGLDEQIGSVQDEVDPSGYEALLRAYREALRSGTSR